MPTIGESPRMKLDGIKYLAEISKNFIWPGNCLVHYNIELHRVPGKEGVVFSSTSKTLKLPDGARGIGLPAIDR